jgi:hypothetical protein
MGKNNIHKTKGNKMKAIRSKAMIVLLLFAFSTALFAQEPKTEKTQKFVEKAAMNFVSSMESECIGVVESSIFLSMELKDKFPESNYNNLIDELNNLAASGKTPTIRYKAQLASLYYNYYPMFSDLKIVDKENPDKYFKQIADRLEQPTVAVK